MLAKLPDFRLSLLGKELTPASSVKDLGVKFDPTLSFNDHILSTVSSCKSSLCRLGGKRGHTDMRTYGHADIRTCGLLRFFEI